MGKPFFFNTAANDVPTLPAPIIPIFIIQTPPLATSEYFSRSLSSCLTLCLGIAFAVAILLVGRFFVDAILRIADVQFRHVQRENLTVVFNTPRPSAVRYELAHLPGVLGLETFRSVPARLRAGYRSRRAVILGLEREGELRRLVGVDRVTPIPADGVVLTAKLAEILRIGPGDTLTVEVLEGSRPVRRVPVAGVVAELLGLSAYMDVGALNRLMMEGNTLSGAFLRVDPRAADSLYGRLKRLPAVAGVSSRDAALTSFEATLARSIGVMTAILVGFAGALAVAMVYNAARIALSERGRELASLRVLGFTRGDHRDETPCRIPRIAGAGDQARRHPQSGTNGEGPGGGREPHEIPGRE